MPRIVRDISTGKWMQVGDITVGDYVRHTDINGQGQVTGFSLDHNDGTYLATVEGVDVSPDDAPGVVTVEAWTVGKCIKVPRPKVQRAAAIDPTPLDAG